MASQDIHNIATTERDTTLNPRQIRSAGFIPGTLYVKGGDSKNVQVKAHEFTQMYLKGARLFKLEGYEGGITAVARQVQVEPLRQDVLNVEFMPFEKASEELVNQSKVVY
jgi:ribosomal protein L25 (general stress protein Ctc)